MPKGEVVINEELCQGCGYCVEFCKPGCIEIDGDKFTPKGYLLPSVVKPQDCTACGVCAWMCPPVAIEVFKYKTEVVN